MTRKEQFWYVIGIVMLILTTFVLVKMYRATVNESFKDPYDLEKSKAQLIETIGFKNFSPSCTYSPEYAGRLVWHKVWERNGAVDKDNGYKTDNDTYEQLHTIATTVLTQYQQQLDNKANNYYKNNFNDQDLQIEIQNRLLTTHSVEKYKNSTTPESEKETMFDRIFEDWMVMEAAMCSLGHYLVPHKHH